MKNVLIVGAIGGVHLGLAFLAALMSGLSARNPIWRILNDVLSLPLGPLSQHFGQSGALTDWAFILANSLIWGVAIWGAGMLATKWLGGLGVPVVAAGLAAGALAIGVAGAARNADTSALAQHYFLRTEVQLPFPFERSGVEIANDIAVFRNLNNGEDPPPPVAERWYWGYRPTSAGHPVYHGVVVVADARAFADRGAFLAELGAQRDPSWRAANWQGVEESAPIVIESALPATAPVKAGEHQRLVRLWTSEPVQGVWMGMVVREARFKRDDAMEVFARMVAGIRSDAGPRADR
jgi:hypothetical protein